MDERVGDATRFDPARAAANRRVTEVVVQTDKPRTEVLDGEPQIPHAASDGSIRGVRVIHGRRVVLLVQADETGDARLEPVDLLREIACIVVPKWRRAIVTNADATHSVENGFGALGFRLVQRRDDHRRVEAGLVREFYRLW